MLKGVVQGAGMGLTLTQIDEIERTVRQGDTSHYIAGGLQCAEVYWATSQVGTVYTAMGKTSPVGGFFTFSFLCIIPLITAIGAAHFNRSTWYGRLIYVVHDHVGTLSLIVSIVSSVALISLGSTVLGVSGLVALGYGTASRLRYIPHCARVQLQPMRKIIEIASKFLLGGWLGTFSAAYETVNLVMDVYLKVRHRTMRQELAWAVKKSYKYVVPKIAVPIAWVMKKVGSIPKDTEITQAKMREILLENKEVTAKIDDCFEFQEKTKQNIKLTPDFIIELLKNPSAVDIDYGHMNAIDFSSAPEIDYTKVLLELFDKQIENDERLDENKKGSSFGNSILFKLDKDDKWKNRHSTEYKGNHVKYVRDNLERGLKAIRDKNITEGDLLSYEVVQSGLKHIAHILNNSRDKIEIQDNLLRLGIEMGAYCSTGKVEAIEDIFCRLKGDTEADDSEGKIKVKDKILISLQMKRKDMALKIYDALTSRKQLEDFGDDPSESDEILQIISENGVISRITHLLGKDDIHNYTFIMNLINANETLGLNSVAASNDTLSKEDPLTTLSNYFTSLNIGMTALMYLRYKETHTPEMVLEHIQELLVNSTKSIDEGDLCEYLCEEIFDQLEGVDQALPGQKPTLECRGNKKKIIKVPKLDKEGNPIVMQYVKGMENEIVVTPENIEKLKQGNFEILEKDGLDENTNPIKVTYVKGLEEIVVTPENIEMLRKGNLEIIEEQVMVSKTVDDLDENNRPIPVYKTLPAKTYKDEILKLIAKKKISNNKAFLTLMLVHLGVFKIDKKTLKKVSKKENKTTLAELVKQIKK